MMAIAKKKVCVDCEPGSKRPAPHPGPRCATCHRARRKALSNSSWETRIGLTYNITADEYFQTLDFQGGKCYICNRATGAVKRLAVDHRHSDGQIRGVLCTVCNRTLGHFRDEPEAFERAAYYLVHPPFYTLFGKRLAAEEPPNGERQKRKRTRRIRKTR